MSDDEIPVEARQNEYANLSDRQIDLLMEEAEEAKDWSTMTKLQVANRPIGAVPAGMTLKEQFDFIDRR